MKSRAFFLSRAIFFPATVASKNSGVGHAWAVKGSLERTLLGTHPGVTKPHQAEAFSDTRLNNHGTCAWRCQAFVSALASDDTAQDGTLIFPSLGCKHFSALSKKLI